MADASYGDEFLDLDAMMKSLAEEREQTQPERNDLDKLRNDLAAKAAEMSQNIVEFMSKAEVEIKYGENTAEEIKAVLAENAKLQIRVNQLEQDQRLANEIIDKQKEEIYRLKNRDN